LEAQRFAGLVEERRDAGVHRLPAQGAFGSAPVDHDAHAEVKGELRCAAVAEIRPHLGHVRPLIRARVQVDQGVAPAHQALEHALGDPGAGASLGVPRKGAVEVAPVGQVAASVSEAPEVDDRERQHGARGFLGIEGVVDTANDLDAVHLVPVEGCREAEGRTGSVAAHHEEGNVEGVLGEGALCREGEAGLRADADLVAVEVRGAPRRRVVAAGGPGDGQGGCDREAEDPTSGPGTETLPRHGRVPGVVDRAHHADACRDTSQSAQSMQWVA
jgi:hypothetical protein